MERLQQPGGNTSPTVSVSNCTMEQSTALEPVICGLEHCVEPDMERSLSAAELVKHLNNDHSYTAVPVNSKAALKRKLSSVQQQLVSSRKKFKVLLQSKRRLVRRNASLQNVIAELRKQNLMGADSLSILETAAGGARDLIMRHINKQMGKSVLTSYSPELRSFALTLHFYSPHAYRYVRRVFNTCLPHPRTIEKWYSSIDGQPGFTDHAFRALQSRTSSTSAPSMCTNDGRGCHTSAGRVGWQKVLRLHRYRN